MDQITITVKQLEEIVRICRKDRMRPDDEVQLTSENGKAVRASFCEEDDPEGTWLNLDTFRIGE
jgi:hypothetical protein